jgi:hypothetical protein
MAQSGQPFDAPLGDVHSAGTSIARTSARATSWPPDRTVHSTTRFRPFTSRTRARSSMGRSIGVGARKSIFSDAVTHQRSGSAPMRWPAAR